MTRTVFLGTPATAVPSLNVVGERTDLRLVVTRPDRPQGRSGRPLPPAVKQAARQYGIPVAQPETKAELRDALISVSPFDVAVVVAFGMILSREALRLAGRGYVNVHFSLLPRWRGAAPVERAILAGDSETGVSLMQVERGLDTGPVLASRKRSIGSSGAEELSRLLAVDGSHLLSEHLDAYAAGARVPVPQPATGATYAERISPDELRLDLDGRSDAFIRAVRAFDLRGAHALHSGYRLKVYAAEPAEPGPAKGNLELRKDGLILGLRDGAVRLISIQLEGRKRMDGRAWARGRQGDLGMLT